MSTTHFHTPGSSQPGRLEASSAHFFHPVLNYQWSQRCAIPFHTPVHTPAQTEARGCYQHLARVHSSPWVPRLVKLGVMALAHTPITPLNPGSGDQRTHETTTPSTNPYHPVPTLVYEARDHATPVTDPRYLQLLHPWTNTSISPARTSGKTELNQYPPSRGSTKHWRNTHSTQARQKDFMKKLAPLGESQHK